MTLESPPPLPNENDAEEGPNDVEMATTDAAELEIELPNEGSPHDETDVEIASKDEYQKTSTLREREFETPKQLFEREASKTLLAQERSELAQQIRAERIENRNNIARLTVELEALRYEYSMTTEDVAQRQQKLQELLAHRAQYATTFAGRIRKLGENMGLSTYLSELDENVATEEENVKLSEERATALAEENDTLEQLITSDRVACSIQERLSEHYTLAGEMSRTEYERQQRTVEQVTMRNNAFILHALALETDSDTGEREYRPVGSPTKEDDIILEDEIDLLTALEPAISTSSVRRGSENTLIFNRQYGVILGGGDIAGAHLVDAESRTLTIKKRNARYSESNTDAVDKVISDKGQGYNELIVNNAKISGVFHKVSGAPSKEGVPALTYIPVAKINAFKKAMGIAHERGVPQYVLTPDNRMFVYISVDDESGFVNVGNEVHPADIAKGGAGFPDEKRLEAGERVLNNQVLKSKRHQREAELLLNRLSAGEKTELDSSDYLEILRNIPSAQEDAYFIRFVYDNLPATNKYSLMEHLPMTILDKELVLYALDRGDTGQGVPKKLYEDPAIKSKILQNIISDYEVESFEIIATGSVEPICVRNEEGEREKIALASDPDLIAMLNDKYRGKYQFWKVSGDEDVFNIAHY